jgi:hypothetical protein
VPLLGWKETSIAHGTGLVVCKKAPAGGRAL